MSSGWRKIGLLTDIPRLGARRIHVEGRTVGVFRTSDDQVFALEDRCPHLGGPLSEGIVHGNAVTCPLHNLVIDLEKGQSVEPRPVCVRSFSVQCNHGAIYVNTAELVMDVSQKAG